MRAYAERLVPDFVYLLILKVPGVDGKVGVTISKKQSLTQISTRNKDLKMRLLTFVGGFL